MPPFRKEAGFNNTMSIPDAFKDEPLVEKLASYFEEIYTFLSESGVPEDRLPSPWHLLSRAVKCIDLELLRVWLDEYVRMESEPKDVEDSETQAARTEPKRPPRHRPSYLRALDEHVEKKDPER